MPATVLSKVQEKAAQMFVCPGSGRKGTAERGAERLHGGGGKVQAKWLESPSLIRDFSHTALCVSQPPCLWDVNSTRSHPLPWLLYGANFPHIVVPASSFP
jgi:hypothetical protein